MVGRMRAFLSLRLLELVALFFRVIVFESNNVAQLGKREKSLNPTCQGGINFSFLGLSSQCHKAASFCSSQ